MNFDRLRPHYETLWASASVRPEMSTEASRVVARMITARDRYEAVSRETGVPWFVVGLIHAMECGQNFGKHLHNGDPLDRPTRQVPAGRPSKTGGPFTFEESACDALVHDKLDEVEDWSIPRVLYEMEKFNGWGYRRHHPEVNSPYLWSGTQHYVSGKYVADGKWDSRAVSRQVGAVALLKTLAVRDPAIVGQWGSVTYHAPEPEPASEESFRKATVDPGATSSMADSKQGNTAITIGGGSASGVGLEVASAVKTARKPAGIDWTEVVLSLLGSPTFWILLTGALGAAYMWYDRRRNLQRELGR